jgi:Protein of unknown function (DUF3309)
MALVLLIILLLLVTGALRTWPYSSWGHHPSGGVGPVLVALLALYLVGYL